MVDMLRSYSTAVLWAYDRSAGNGRLFPLHVRTDNATATLAVKCRFERLTPGKRLFSGAILYSNAEHEKCTV
jgi:hypothetical protein